LAERWGGNSSVYTQSNINSAVFVNDPKRPFPRLAMRKGGTATLSNFSEIIDGPLMQGTPVFIPCDSKQLNPGRERRAADQKSGASRLLYEWFGNRAPSRLDARGEASPGELRINWD
jgi:hypothetical protein